MHRLIYDLVRGRNGRMQAISSIHRWRGSSHKNWRCYALEPLLRLYSLLIQGRRQGFRPGWAKIRREAPKIFFRLPTLVFSLPTLPYVMVAHPAHRTEADLREKASLATNQEGPLPSPPLRLT